MTEYRTTGLSNGVAYRPTGLPITSAQPGDLVRFTGETAGYDPFFVPGEVYTVGGKYHGKYDYFGVIDKDYRENGWRWTHKLFELVSVVDEEIPMVFVIGKAYQNKIGGSLSECIAFDPNGSAIFRGVKKRNQVFEVKVPANWEEYVPPVVHTRYVHWVNYYGKPMAFLSERDGTIFSKGVEGYIKTDVVTYTESK